MISCPQAGRSAGDGIAAEEGIASNILADRLKRLEQRELVEKLRDEDDARQFVYRPTELAIDLVPMLMELFAWGSEHGDIAGDQDLVDRFRSDREA